ncbi:hypothetical protein ACFX5F_05195 [Flavobacterium sp. ZS1P70]|uniref:Uncharacterized protein n=1 Tax=Flavobacterium zhoui TaxID=3230414 RepID=A0ABW6I3U9_9FLAO
MIQIYKVYHRNSPETSGLALIVVIPKPRYLRHSFVLSLRGTKQSFLTAQKI